MQSWETQKTGCILKAWSIKIWLITYFGNKHILKISEILFLLLFKVHPFFKEEMNVEQWTINEEQVTMSHFAWLQTTSFFIKYWRIIIDIQNFMVWNEIWYPIPSENSYNFSNIESIMQNIDMASMLNNMLRRVMWMINFNLLNLGRLHNSYIDIYISQPLSTYTKP